MAGRGLEQRSRLSIRNGRRLSLISAFFGLLALILAFKVVKFIFKLVFGLIALALLDPRKQKPAAATPWREREADRKWEY